MGKELSLTEQLCYNTTRIESVQLYMAQVSLLVLNVMMILLACC